MRTKIDEIIGETLYRQIATEMADSDAMNILVVKRILIRMGATTVEELTDNLARVSCAMADLALDAIVAEERDVSRAEAAAEMTRASTEMLVHYLTTGETPLPRYGTVDEDAQ